MEIFDILRTRKLYPAVPIDTCVYRRRLDEAKEIVNKTYVIESCSREDEQKQDLLQVDKLNCVCCSPQRPCIDAVLPEPLLKNHTVNCLTLEENTRQPYKDNLCLFRALALHLH